MLVYLVSRESSVSLPMVVEVIVAEVMGVMGAEVAGDVGVEIAGVESAVVGKLFSPDNVCFFAKLARFRRSVT